MMTPRQYRQKAQQALDVAKAIGDPASKAAWEATAAHWLGLALAAEVQDGFAQAAAGLASNDGFEQGGSGTLQ